MSINSPRLSQVHSIIQEYQQNAQAQNQALSEAFDSMNAGNLRGTIRYLQIMTNDQSSIQEVWSKLIEKIEEALSTTVKQDQAQENSPIIERTVEFLSSEFLQTRVLPEWKLSTNSHLEQYSKEQAKIVIQDLRNQLDEAYQNKNYPAFIEYLTQITHLISWTQDPSLLETGRSFYTLLSLLQAHEKMTQEHQKGAEIVEQFFSLKDQIIPGLYAQHNEILTNFPEAADEYYAAQNARKNIPNYKQEEVLEAQTLEEAALNKLKILQQKEQEYIEQINLCEAFCNSYAFLDSNLSKEDLIDVYAQQIEMQKTTLKHEIEVCFQSLFSSLNTAIVPDEISAFSHILLQKLNSQDNSSLFQTSIPREYECLIQEANKTAEKALELFEIQQKIYQADENHKAALQAFADTIGSSSISQAPSSANDLEALCSKMGSTFSTPKVTAQEVERLDDLLAQLIEEKYNLISNSTSEISKILTQAEELGDSSFNNANDFTGMIQLLRSIVAANNVLVKNQVLSANTSMKQILEQIVSITEDYPKTKLSKDAIQALHHFRSTFAELYVNNVVDSSVFPVDEDISTIIPPILEELYQNRLTPEAYTNTLSKLEVELELRDETDNVHQILRAIIENIRLVTNELPVTLVDQSAYSDNPNYSWESTFEDRVWNPNNPQSLITALKNILQTFPAPESKEKQRLIRSILEQPISEKMMQNS